MMKNKKNGFTAVELLIALALTVIMVAIAIPNFLAWLPNHRLRVATRDMLSNLQQIKLEAIKNNSLGTITFNQTVDGKRYDYVAFVDDDGDMEYDAGERVLAKVDKAEYKDITGVSSTFIANDVGLPAIAFRPNGVPRDNSGNTLTVGRDSGFLVNTKGKTAQVLVSPAGNIRVQ
jgi:type IV fimbrial biogenesis protein FimT